VSDRFKAGVPEPPARRTWSYEIPGGLPGRAIRQPVPGAPVQRRGDVYDGRMPPRCLKSCSHNFCIIDRLGHVAKRGHGRKGWSSTGENVWKIKDIQREGVDRPPRRRGESVYAPASRPRPA